MGVGDVETVGHTHKVGVGAVRKPKHTIVGVRRCGNITPPTLLRVGDVPKAKAGVGYLLFLLIFFPKWVQVLFYKSTLTLSGDR